MHCASGQARIQSWRECGRRGCRRQDFASVLTCLGPEIVPTPIARSGPHDAPVEQRKQQKPDDEAADMRFPGDAGLLAEDRDEP